MNKRGWFVLFALLPLMLADTHASILSSGKGIVVSGDDITIGTVPFHLRGVDAFEFDQQCFSGPDHVQCGVEAKKVLEALVGGRDIFCGGSGDDDTDGRVDAICGHGATHDLGMEMVRRGWALARPDRNEYQAYQLCFAEGEARRSRRGAWQYKFVPPYVHRGEKVMARGGASCGNVPVTSP